MLRGHWVTHRVIGVTYRAGSLMLTPQAVEGETQAQNWDIEWPRLGP